MRGNGKRTGSTDVAVNRFTRRLEAAVARKERMPERDELIELIESGRHVLIGAKALAHYTKPRFTEDTDYIVSGQTFARIRKWARERRVEHQNLGMVFRFLTLGVGVIDARSNAVLKEVLQLGKSPPSAEALAAANYISFINPVRGHRRIQDVADFAQLVTLPQFDLNAFRALFVGVYEHQWVEAEKLVADIKTGKRITI